MERSDSSKVLLPHLSKSPMPALWRNCFLPAQATIYFTESSLTGAERLSPSQRNSPHSDSSMRAVTTAPAEHTPTYSQCHFFLVQETSASPCVHNICSPKSGNSWQLAGKGVTTIRLAAGKGLRPTRSSLAEREMQTGCLELRGEQSFIFEAIRIAGDPTDGRQCDTTHGQGPVEPAGNSLAPGARARPGGERGAGGHAAPGAGAAGPLLRLLSARPRPGSGTSQSRHPPCGVRPCYRPALGGHRPSGPSRPQRRRPPPPGLVPLPPRLTGRGGRRSSPRGAGTGGCWPSLRGSARSSSSSSSRRRRQAQRPRVRAALPLPRRPPADSSPQTAPTPASPWRTPRLRRPAAASAPFPARPRRPGSGVTDRRAAPRESESRPPTTPRTPRAPPARNYTSRRARRRDPLAPVRVPSVGADGSWSPRKRAPPVGRSRQRAGCRRSPSPTRGICGRPWVTPLQFAAPGSLVIDTEQSVRLALGNWAFSKLFGIGGTS